MGFSTLGPGSPSSLTTSGAAIARTIEEHDEAERGERDAVLAQPAPEKLQRRACGDLLARLRDVEPSARPRGISRRRRRSCQLDPQLTKALSSHTTYTRGLPVRRPHLANLLTIAHPQLANDASTVSRHCPVCAVVIRPSARMTRYCGGWTRCSTPIQTDGSRTIGRARAPRERSSRVSAGGARDARRAAATIGRAHAPAQPRRVRRPGAPARRRLGAAQRDRARAAALDGALRAARLGQDDARAAGRRALAGGLRGAQRRAGRARGGARGDRARRAPALAGRSGRR